MIHKFENNGHFFALDVESGTVIEPDGLSYALLGEWGPLNLDEVPQEVRDKYSEEEIREAYSEIGMLKEQGLLYTEPAAEMGDYVHNRQLKALCLHVAHDCNLRCSYCFAGQGDFSGERSLMPSEVAKAAIDFVIRESGNRHNIEIDFFGGEPLMNLGVVKETVAYARGREEETGKHFNFTLTTNGLLLNEEIREWLDENMDNVVLSIDGRPEVNDRMRKTVSGEGSYRHILGNILKMAERREGKKDYYVRATFTKNNLDFSKDVKHLYSLGIKSLSAEPVVANAAESYALSEEDLPTIFHEYDELAKFNLDNDFTFFHFNINLDAGPCIYKRMSGCGAGIDYLAVTPEGELFPCHQFVSNKAFSLGNVYDGVTNKSIQEAFGEAGMENKESCRECWCRYLCGGGCHANAYSFNHTLMEPYQTACEMQRRRAESAIMLYALKNG